MIAKCFEKFKSWVYNMLSTHTHTHAHTHTHTHTRTHAHTHTRIHTYIHTHTHTHTYIHTRTHTHTHTHTHLVTSCDHSTVVHFRHKNNPRKAPCSHVNWEAGLQKLWQRPLSTWHALLVWVSVCNCSN